MSQQDSLYVANKPDLGVAGNIKGTLMLIFKVNSGVEGADIAIAPHHVQFVRPNGEHCVIFIAGRELVLKESFESVVTKLANICQATE